MRFILLFSLLMTAVGLSAQTTSFYFPPKVGINWETTSLAQAGFCPDRVDSLYQFLDDTDTKSFILLKDGKIVLEKYFGTFTRDSFWYWASAGKSLTGFLVGQAQEEGLLDLNDQTSTYLGAGWTSCPPEKEALITVWNQITMTNGLEDNVPDDNCTTPSCLTYKADAGTRWAYHNAPYHLVHNVLEAASGLTLQQFTKSRVLDKTGMKGLWIDHIQYGRARDMARFGLLNLAKGIWDGDTLLHDQDYLTSMHTPSQALNNSYGYLWWLNGQTSFMLPGVQFMVPGPICPNAPADMYAALGKNDQKIHVVPSKGWVVVRQGNSANVSPVPIVFDNLMWGYLNQLECTSTAFEPEKQTLQVEIAPTVTAQYWTLTTSKPVSRVAVYSGVGARVMDYFTTSDSSGITIPTSQFAPGWYYIVLTDAAGQQTVVKGAKM